MKCPFCGEADTKVTDTRAVDDNAVIRRRRLCERCQNRFITYERLDTIPLTVIKRSGQREPFDRDKIMMGLMRSCNKRIVTVDQMEKLVSDIEAVFFNSGKREIETKDIGEMVMEGLKELDEVSYVRFASVYKQFRDLDTFMDELTGMLREKESRSSKPTSRRTGRKTSK